MADLSTKLNLRNRLKSLLTAGLMLTTIAVSAVAPWGDYTLYAPQNSNKAYLLDLSGNTYHTWTFATSQKTAYSTYMEAGGTLVRTVTAGNSTFNGGPISGIVQKVDYNGNVTWTYTHSTTTYCLHHDICPMPNGNVLMISYELKTAAEATQAGCSQNITIWSEKIIEVQPTGATTGNIVWEWHIWDHLCQNSNSAKSNYVSSIVNNPQLLNINYNTSKDWMHMNGVDYNPVLDQITFSSHNLNEIYVIDHSTTTAQAASHTGGNSGKGGDLLYRWGNPLAYGAAGTKNFNVVHDAHWVPYGIPKGGYLGAFNNKGGTGNKSCVDLINPPVNGYLYNITPGSSFAPTTYDWRHTYSGTATNDMGNSQQLPNGNTLVCIAQSGYIYEIDSNQTVVWSKSTGTTVPKAFRYSASYITGITATASATPTDVCLGSSSTLNAVASGGTGYTYTWASSPAGFTSTIQNPVVTPSVTTTYTVTVTSGTSTVTANATVVVHNPPVAPVISQVGNTLSSTASVQYQWYLNGSIINGATLQTYAPTQTGKYTVMITDQYGCTTTSPDFDFTFTGISDLTAANPWRLYPNPSSGVVKVEGINDGDPVAIFDQQGRKSIRYVTGNTLEMASLPRGIYFISLENAPEKGVTKLVLLK
jgi:hypothetical protein